MQLNSTNDENMASFYAKLRSFRSTRVDKTVPDELLFWLPCQPTNGRVEGGRGFSGGEGTREVVNITRVWIYFSFYNYERAMETASSLAFRRDTNIQRSQSRSRRWPHTKECYSARKSSNIAGSFGTLHTGTGCVTMVILGAYFPSKHGLACELMSSMPIFISQIIFWTHLPSELYASEKRGFQLALQGRFWPLTPNAASRKLSCSHVIKLYIAYSLH